MSKQVDDAFLADVIERAGNHYPHDIIRATLAVAAERGMVVGEVAPRMWAVKGIDVAMHTASTSRRKSESVCVDGENESLHTDGLTESDLIGGDN